MYKIENYKYYIGAPVLHIYRQAFRPLYGPTYSTAPASYSATERNQWNDARLADDATAAGAQTQHTARRLTR